MTLQDSESTKWAGDDIIKKRDIWIWCMLANIHIYIYIYVCVCVFDIFIDFETHFVSKK